MSDTTRTAMLIGGTGQIGSAVARRLAADGWSVLVAHRGEHHGDTELSELDVTSIRLDRDDTDALIERARGHDLVLDTVAYEPRHGEQLARLAGEVGSLVVISTGSVYTGRDGGYLDIVTGPDDFPDYPVPLRETDPTVDNDERTYSPLKAALERTLLAVDDLPVSILRPGAVYGPFSPALREWYFIKRALDGRDRVVLSDDGANRFSTSSTVNIAELVALCADRPGKRVLNAVDTDDLSVADIAGAVYRALDRDLEVVAFPGPPVDGVGSTPWTVAHPLLLSMAGAAVELGYRQQVHYEEAVAAAVDWAVREVKAAELRQEDWTAAFPGLAKRAEADRWFDYSAEDAFVAAR
ncbi:NAD-dependent epimerase/dehydratase family protein [Leifsonia aquatica]|uniref:NAD dependent epimerase/dehydratase family protein n=2 Tax=Leifsonia aquatica TaxID=144185 RepID=U2RV44_LEIAQ|nr:NAD-dependent epimerase/dehydratase family protein [Leifsonia aquatica]ERK72409.1 NAD dependent epimerase/dehydratase family protein [Leifsonia aquatica ATCC 14665]MBB2967413.1 nucleoside-diphosphate-sugar epimerase [Leifsonia aquatica]